MQDVTGITSYRYDADGKLIGTTDGIGKALTYTFDPVGSRTLLLDSDGGYTTYAYDAQSRLTGIINPYNELTTLQYDALDRESVKTLASGMSINHTYDAAGRETVLSNLASNGSALAIYTASYDAVGNRLNVVELDGTRVTFGYDPSYQLISEQWSGSNAYNTTYTYDPLGNRLVKNDGGQLTTYSYNAANELVLLQPSSGQPTTNTYDADGNLLVENAGGSLTTYTWDTENRLIGISYPDGTVDTYSYSADGLREKKATSSGTVYFVRDGENVLIETDAGLVTQAHYTDFPGMWGGLASERRGSVSSFYGFDPQSNTRILVSIGGNITDSYLYKAFGEELAVSGTTVNPMRYGGQVGYWRDIASRLYVRARHYRTDLGRWMSRDPIFTEDGLSQYSYNQNTITEDYKQVKSGVNLFIKPTGLSSLTCSDVGFLTEYHIEGSGKVHAKGWIIQHIRFEWHVFYCNNNQPVPLPTGWKNFTEYWEAWQVRKGKISYGPPCKNRGLGGYDILLPTGSVLSNMYGNISEIGKVAFVSGYHLKESKTGPWHCSSRKSHIPPGWLPWRKNAPKGWNDKKAQDHYLKIKFNCCCKKHKQTIECCPKYHKCQ